MLLFCQNPFTLTTHMLVSTKIRDGADPKDDGCLLSSTSFSLEFLTSNNFPRLIFYVFSKLLANPGPLLTSLGTKRQTKRKRTGVVGIMSLAIQAILLILCSPVPIPLGGSLLVTAVLKYLI